MEYFVIYNLILIWFNLQFIKSFSYTRITRLALLRTFYNEIELHIYST